MPAYSTPPAALGVHHTPPPDAVRGFAHAPGTVERRQRTAPVRADNATSAPLPPGCGAVIPTPTVSPVTSGAMSSGRVAGVTGRRHSTRPSPRARANTSVDVVP